MLGRARRIWRAIAPTSLREAAGLTVGRIVFESTVHALARRPRRPGIGPAALVGFFNGTSGVALSAQLASRALDDLGVEHRQIDVGNIAAPNDPGERSAAAWIFYMNPPELISILNRWSALEFRGPLFGYWAWELPKAPRSWQRAVGAMDAVMAPSRFAADAFGSWPVTVTPHPLFVDDYQAMKKQPRCADDEFTALSIFDFKSSMARKNPFGALRAFRMAFKGDPAARLIIKTQNSDIAPELAAALRAEAGPVVEIIDGVWPHAKVLELIASADVLISLHRAEGFGLTLAEAMALGVPVVTTAWSGNLDFMDLDTAGLVPAKLTLIDDEQRIYRGRHWADPDISVAAAYLRRLKDDPAYAESLTLRASARIARQLNPRTWFESLPPLLRDALVSSEGSAN